MEIAIIGAGLLFPAKIESLSDLWNFMMGRGDASAEIPPDRWSVKRFYSPVPQSAGKTTMARGNFIIHDAKAFDCAIFGLSPREASLLDPLQRNILLAAWRAIEDAKLAPRQIKGSRTGVYVGAFLDDFLVYAGRSEMRSQIQDHYSAVCSTAGMVSARLGHVFNLLGPAMSVDTACSSSMTAIVRACDDLAQGNCDMALAGGSSYMMIPEPSITMSKSGFLAKDGRSKSFSKMADGYGRGEGAGILLLKPLARALEDQDPVRAVISAGALNQDGRTAAVPVPSRKAQALLMQNLLQKAGIHPDDLSAIEAHGAGTPVGDPIEAAAVCGAIAAKRSPKAGTLPIGSIKANIGHLEASAGVAGILRAMLCLEHGALPPWPCDGEPADFLTENHLHLPLDGMKLPKKSSGRPHYILANSFGYGGANAAVLLRSFQSNERKRRKKKKLPAGRPENFLILSAASRLALKYVAREYASLIRNFVEKHPDSSEKQAIFWNELCETILVQRDLLTHRLVLCKEARPLSEMAEILTSFAEAEGEFQAPEGSYAGEVSDSVTLENILLLFSASPTVSLREGAVFLLDLPSAYTPKAAALMQAKQLLQPETDLTSEIFAEIRETGKFKPLSPFTSAMLQILAGEYFQELGLKVSGTVSAPSKMSGTACIIASYFNQKIDAKETLHFLDAGSEAALPFPMSSSSSSALVVMLGSGGGQRDFLALKRKLPLEQALKDAAAHLLAEGAGILPRESGFRQLDLPPYPMGLEMLAGPERLAARKDRVDLTIHPLLGTEQDGSEKSWKADLTTGFLPWLPDHAMRRKNGQASDWLFPFAAFIEAGLAAHKQMTGQAACILENMRLKMPLFPARDLTTVIFWNFYAESRKLKLTSWNPASLGAENPFLPHGFVSLSKSVPWAGDRLFSSADEAAFEKMKKLDIPVFYKNFRHFGIYYGPAFRSVTQLRISGRNIGDMAIGDIMLPETVRQDMDGRYLLHPVLLDGAFQMAAALIPETSENAYAPSGMVRFIWHGCDVSEPLTQMRAKMILKDFSENALILDGEFYSADGKILGEIRGLECAALAKKKPIALVDAKWEILPPLSLLAEAQKLFIFGKEAHRAAQSLEKLAENGRQIEHFPSLSAFQQAFKAAEKPEKLIYFPDFQTLEDPLHALSLLLQEMQALLKVIPIEEKFSFVIAGQGAFAGLEGVSFDEKSLWLAPLVGFIRSARVEYPSIRFKVVFFQKEEAIAQQLAAELVSDDFAETEIFLSAEGRHTLRANPVKPLSLLKKKKERVFDAKNHSAITLIRDDEGRKFIQGLGWENQILPPLSPDQVRVKTIAAGLNFKDFLNVMGLVPEFVLRNTHTAGILGLEALVEIEACGSENTDFKKGDLCLSFVSGAFTSHRLLTVDKTLLFPIPKGVCEEFPLSMIKQLAGFSVAAATAWACLVRLANLEEGETILIHSAAGGVGQMALQIAQLKGAKIFATAGSAERRAWLKAQKNVVGVFDSRTLSFYDGVQAATEGKGVDVVLNSLSGEALQATLKLMAPFGRFIEIGKRDIIEGGALDLTPFNENLAFFSYDLDRMLHARPEMFRQDCRKIYALILERKIIPPTSTFFPPEKVQEAFRHFASNAHAGRIILDFCPEEGNSSTPLLVRDNPKNTFFADPDAVHLVTGGTGGFGMETLRWLFRNGARHLHVIAKNDPSGRKGWQELQQAAKACNATIDFHACDLLDADKITEILQKITQKRKLGAIFHAAGYLKDAPLAELSLADMQQVLAPKIGGALSLWQALQTLGLKPAHFILYSSLAGFTGNFGQAAYGAANVFLDVFAGFLRSKNINALSVAWGAIAQGGMLKQGNALAVFRQSGIGIIGAEQALEAMTVLAQTEKMWGAVASVDWSLFFKTLAELGREARFSLLNEKEDLDTNKVLLSLPPSERRAFALRVILEEVSAILQLEAGGITARTPLESLGLDSLAGMELQVAVQKRLGVEIPVSVLATARTPDALAGKIADRTMDAAENNAFQAGG